ncbi:hypothetical protein [Sutcliffiella rhizosphaerae]|uniref:Group-specific protein n=1 Tax=Sutcliffiella rhizosphaerae TaxID=2880967 RepID=A0ABM8YP06_9BACI|nr:hypothetical protein [Sutcliffiella rhizosphaerae]CAG9621730.1 hypothetical protein BACCIP111883_02503 [Sutcliffiella rhizosphaerae]
MKKTFILLLIFFSSYGLYAYAQPLQVEVFDVKQSEVIKQIPLEENIRKEAFSLVKSADSLFPKLNPTPISGFMVKVPFEPEEEIETKVLHQKVNQVIFIFPEAEKPYMLIFNEKKQPMFYYFSEDHLSFLKHIKMEL